MRSQCRPMLQPILRKALSRSRVLSAERERELLQRYHADQDRAAMDELVLSHMPIIFRVAGRSAQNPGVDINDLVQTATEGLLIAINRWSFEKSEASVACGAVPTAGEQDADTLPTEQDLAPATAELPRSSRLATYAMWWMRILLTNTVIENRGMIVRAKNPKTRKALFNLPAAIRKLDISLPLSGTDVTRIAAYLGIAEREIEEALVHAAGDVMLDEPMGDGATLRGDAMPDSRAEGEDGILSRLASTDRWGAVCEALMELAPRERFILITRYLLTSKWKLDRLSDTLKMSRERIRQIGDDSLDHIRKRVSAHGVCHDPARQLAVERAEALVAAVEQASMSGETGAIARFLSEQKIAIGPTRVLKRRLPIAAPRAVASYHHLPAPVLQTACG